MKNPVWPHFYFAEEDDDVKREGDKLPREVDDGMSLENPKKEGIKDTKLEATFKALNIQPQEGTIDKKIICMVKAGLKPGVACKVLNLA